MSISKVVYGSRTLIDLTSDNITAAALVSGYSAHGSNGEVITGTIIARTASDIGVAGPTISVPSGAYSVAVSTTIRDAVLNTNFSLSLDRFNYSLNSGTGLLSITGSVSKQADSVRYSSGAGYASYVANNIRITTTVSSNYQLPVEAAATITPTESAQTAAQSGKFLIGNITVAAISSDYIGSNISQRSSSDLAANGSYINVPSGYYAAAASKAIAYGSYKSNDSISVTPGITINSNNGLIQSSVNVTSNRLPVNSAGYFDNTFGLKTVVAGSSSKQLDIQAATTISPTESVQTAVAAGKFTTGIVKVGAISSNYVGSNIPQRTSSNLSASGSYIIVPSGYYAAQASKSVSGGSAKTPATTITAQPAISISASGLITATNSKTQNVTPTVTAGYVSSGTAGTITVNGSNTSQLTTKAAATYTPGTLDQTISANQYLTGAQTVKGDANLIAANIASGVTIFGITGTHQGGITPTGTIAISSNGTYDVTNYATASVKVGATVSGAKLIVPEGMIGV